MKKKNIIIIASVAINLIIIAIVAFVLNNNTGNNKLAERIFYNDNVLVRSIQDAEQLDIEKPMVVVFYADYCKNCHDFRPAYLKLANDLKNDYSFVALDIEDPTNQLLVASNVHSIPALYIFDPQIGNKIFIPLQTIRNYGQLKAEFERYTRIRSFLDIDKAQKTHSEIMNEYAKHLEIKK